MNSYLLLRNNKKSGPFNLQQLLNMGLKPYDLLWVEGKSAAWSYASEVAELKQFAPIVEEQPFDRFYKKPEAESQPAEKKVIRKPEEIEKPKIQVESQERKVFVSLPKNYSAVPKDYSVVTNDYPVVRNIPPVYTPPLSKEMPLKEKVEATPEKGLVLQEEYSESLDDIKKRYAEIYLTRKKNNRFKKNLNAVLQVAGGAIFICVLAVVVYNNFSTEENSSKTNKPASKKQVVATRDEPAKTTPADKKQTTNPVVKNQSKQAEKNESNAGKTAIVNQEQGTTREKAITQNSAAEKNSSEAYITAKKEKETSEIPKAVIVKPVKKSPETYNIRKYVSVSANNYKRRPFGGIMNLQLTVNNDSRFVLETVVVELEYLKPSEQPLKTERIIFNSIAPLGSQTIKVPDFLRGVAVNYWIKSIESSSLDKYNAER